MNPIQFIAAKRDGQEHQPAEVAAFIEQYMHDAVADYQVSAWLMAAFLRGLNDREAWAVTDALLNSGRSFPFAHFGCHSVDKHSTGGVGDKTSLVVVPLCAALGATVPKMSGRGLGFTGGTLDKLEAIPGFRTRLTVDEFTDIVSKVGAAICAQTTDLVPADGRLYALRDVTATVESIPLIAASVMSKKLALGCPAIALDVKVGSGAFMQTVPEASKLAELMLSIGKESGRKVVALVTNMDQPLGHAIGNILEVKEAVDTLSNTGPDDFREHCLVIAGEMLVAANIFTDIKTAKTACLQALSDGRALAKFREMVLAQGGHWDVIANDALPKAPVICEVAAKESGYVSVHAKTLGLAAMVLGAGRKRKEDKIDPAVGIIVSHKIGDFVRRGDLLALIHARDENTAQEATSAVTDAFSFSTAPVAALPLVYTTIKSA